MRDLFGARVDFIRYVIAPAFYEAWASEAVGPVDTAILKTRVILHDHQQKKTL